MRIARALGALLLLALLLFGAPLALAALGGPGYLLTVDWGNALVSTGNSRLILALLSLVGWLAWLAVALTVVFEMVAVLSAHSRTHLRRCVMAFVAHRAVLGVASDLRFTADR